MSTVINPYISARKKNLAISTQISKLKRHKQKVSWEISSRFSEIPGIKKIIPPYQNSKKVYKICYKILELGGF